MPKKTHKIALDPNNKQRKWFAQQCGYARWSYNQALADFKKHYDATGEYLSVGKLDKRFNVYKKEHAWTADMDQVVCSQSIYKYLGAAITNWIKERARFPVFKKKGRKDSFSSKNGSAEVKGKWLRLPKMGWVKRFQRRLSRRVQGSKTCCSCGNKKDDLKLSERTYHCGVCGISIDRDINDAINLRDVSVGKPTETQNACGDPVRLYSEAKVVETGKVIWQRPLLPI